MRTFVYVDAFNLYYGCLKGTPYRWLNLDALCQALLPRHSLDRIIYYTALLKPLAHDKLAPVHQQAYLRALKTLPHADIVLGHYLSHEVNMPLATPVPGGSRMARVVKTEEKGSDVNLAVHMVHDAHKGLYDAAVVISNDSDLAEAVRIVRAELGKVVGVLNPQSRPSRELQKHATFFKAIRAGVLAASQFPPTLTDGRGTFHKPAGW